jgi:CheY-like chemotaxis protein
MTILFIDDDPDDTELFCEAVDYLNNSEFIATKKEIIDCVTVNNGCIALDLLPNLKEVPHFIFLDVNMPMMGGEECLRHLKKLDRYSMVPIIMFSTAFGKDQAKEFKAIGASDCILKPSGFNELVKILSKYVYEKYR